MADNLDYTSKYNTPLSADEKGGFEGWAKTQSETVGRDVTKDLYDYDLQGWWKNNQGVDLSGGHLTDQWKKPNHPTFSDQSQYHGADGLQGGQWGQSQDGSYSFKPGATNLKNFSADELKDYFKKVEPGNRLMLPPE
jgi:hypothetical protein